MKFIRKHIKLITIISLLIISITLIGLKIYLNNYSNPNSEIVSNDESEIIKSPLDEEIMDTNQVEKEIVFVDIKGAVAVPGVYELEVGKKVIDQTTPNMIQRICRIFERNPLISKEI